MLSFYLETIITTAMTISPSLSSTLLTFQQPPSSKTHPVLAPNAVLTTLNSFKNPLLSTSEHSQCTQSSIQTNHYRTHCCHPSPFFYRYLRWWKPRPYRLNSNPGCHRSLPNHTTNLQYLQLRRFLPRCYPTRSSSIWLTIIEFWVYWWLCFSICYAAEWIACSPDW